ncbi:MAG: flavin reductase family protein [Actinomycetota bacterium]|nr:flavin reductase family protein [Actinomycetota bacterium]MDQ2957846.1 flavin reductase family protein [Actinomycetota bacterium]
MNWLSLDPDELTAAERRDLLLLAVVPRPIAWTSTLSTDGIRNLAPFSYFTVISNDPPMIALSLERRSDGMPKDTLVNIQETGEFVVSIASVPLLNQLWQSSMEFSSEQDEFSLCDVDACASDLVRPPRVRNAPISFECRLVEICHPGSDSVIFGRVVKAHLDRAILDHRRQIDPARIRPIARVGDGFAAVGSRLRPRARRRPTGQPWMWPTYRIRPR